MRTRKNDEDEQGRPKHPEGRRMEREDGGAKLSEDELGTKEHRRGWNEE